MKTIIWNIFVGILVLVAIIGDIQMVSSLEKTSPEENYITQDDIDRATNSNNLIIKAIKREGL